MQEKHTHRLENGEVVTHSHDFPHAHVHDPEEVRAIINRLAKAIGHLESVKHMVEDGKDCTEVMIQLAAVKSAINNTGKLILKQHLSHCIVSAVEQGDNQAIDDLNQAIDRFL
ncbi:MAG: metal-sensing transcriptional repressor [Eubacterium sp.]|nr:metal-sensing transcriptional repressor [Eubacterium sp.]